MKPTQEEFIAVMSEAFSPEATVMLNIEFREMEEWSSMQALIVIAAIDEHFGVTVPEKKFREAKTFQALYELTVSSTAL